MEEIADIANDVLGSRGVAGLLIVTRQKGVLFKELTDLTLMGASEEILSRVLEFYDTVSSMFDASVSPILDGVTEFDLKFTQYRIYILAIPDGVLAVVMTPDASAAAVRLHCNILIPKLEQTNTSVIGNIFSRLNTRR